MQRLRLTRRWTVTVLTAVILIGGGGAAWAMTRSSDSGNGNTQLVAAKVATINETVSTSGTIAAAQEADLNFESNGRVTHVNVAVGDKVKKGETLATIGTSALRPSYDSAKATYTAAVEAVAEASGGSSTEVAAAHSSLVAAKSGLKTARTSLRGAHLRSTINGTVTSLDLTKGQSVSSTGSAGSSSSQVVVQSSKTFIVNATVDDTEVKSVKKGQKVSVTPDGADTAVDGVVKTVSAVPDTSSSVVSFPVVIAVNGHPSGVYAGASATASITTKHVANVLEIPTLAITYDNSTATVKVRSGGSTATRTITVGTSYGAETQVLSGLKSGEQVVVATPTFPGRPTGGSGSGGTGEFPGGGTFPGGGEFPGGGSFPGGGTFTNGNGPGAFSGQG